jgi:hypothetical protein
MPKLGLVSKRFLQSGSESNDACAVAAGWGMLARMFFASKRRRRLLIAFLGLIGTYGLLSIPEAEPPALSGAGKSPFVWARDQLWQNLEKQFREARQLSPAGRVAAFEASQERLNRALDQIAATNLPPDAAAFDDVEFAFFQFAVLAAVSPERNAEFMQAASRLAQLAKVQAQHWSGAAPAARQRSYRLLFGRRAAVEEVLVQVGPALEPLELATPEEASATPFTELHGVRLQSGDILVSRGGAATSALIARGNDYRGNFSHVALIHVDEQTRKISVIESRIECGVSVRPIEEYLADTKLRILVLRLRADLLANPQVPHLAASFARSNALARHIPYDFTMDYTDPARQFCSEVVSSAYQSQGIRLWSGLSQVSAPGLTHWLAILGVRNFESQQPSDLEYDAQLRFVAEWRNPEALAQDRMDNAIIDARLEAAERGAKLDFNRWLLPPMRVVKAGCWVLNQRGATGPIPEGMSATTALRVEAFKQRHAEAREQLRQAAAAFQKTKGYAPPYWELLLLAREVSQKTR